MADSSTLLCLVMVTGLFLVFCPVSAAEPISTISAGNTVFVGEQGLDIRAAMNGDTILGWWASGAAISSSSPGKTISVPNPGSFSIYPSDFQSHTGSWYHLSGPSTPNGTAFSVADPYIEIRIEDTTVSTDVTNKWVPTDDELQFRIDTNLVQMLQRANVNSVPVTIKVRGPDGILYSALTDKSGQTTSLVDYGLTTSPQYTGAIWGTSNRAMYSPGTYSVWVECNANSIKDNYGQSGKAVSQTVTVLNQDQNPLIGNKGYVTNPTTSTPMVTTRTPTPTATTVVTTSPPPTTVPTPTVTAMAKSLAATPQPATSAVPAVPTTHTPGFGAGLAVLSFCACLSFFLKKH
ncbi:DUF3821 domain-containing protein [Methanoregula sp.]|uniref:DUF3821 domain-containing protein n=1 Tax=Methanoregula sp. TaxID=2052170 RepID=UPI00262030EF|nr:DUF3821 domain-containing protein [Methanoregula sp.]MDD5143566.1 DUF3821 domain-containing protein [Methanoregula sp.]